MPLVPVDVCDAKRGKGDEGHCGEGQLCSLSICVCEIRRERERLKSFRILFLPFSLQQQQKEERSREEGIAKGKGKSGSQGNLMRGKGRAREIDDFCCLDPVTRWMSH